jgi:Putative restriction endonuclease
MATAEMLELMTAEQFGKRPDPGYPEELLQGRVVSMPPPDRKHGLVCGQAYYIVRLFVDERDLGRVMSNDSGVITERDPDTVRGADVAYYSYARLPRGTMTGRNCGPGTFEHPAFERGIGCGRIVPFSNRQPRTRTTIHICGSRAAEDGLRQRSSDMRANAVPYCWW